VAGAKAKGIVEEGERRRAQIETVIAELDARRDGTLEELDRLRRELASTIGEYASTGKARGRGGETNGERTDKKSAGAVAERG
jgi:hypothetical protein